MVGFQIKTTWAQEIAPFRMTGIEGSITTRYVSDEYNSAQNSGGVRSSSHQAQSLWRNEVSVMTHNYVYHPKFLSLDIGGGPVLDSQTLSNDTGSYSSRSNLYNFTSRANFFRDMPIRGNAWFDHLSPTVSLAPGEVMTQENTRYGWEVLSSGPKVGWPMRLGYSHQSSDGVSSQRSVHDLVDQVGFSLGRTFGSTGSSQFQFQSTDQTSRSGSVSLPIQTATSHATSMTLDTRLQFGKDQQFDVTNLISLNNRSYVIGGISQPAQQDASFLVSLFGRHSRELNSFANVHLTSISQGGIDTRTESLASGLTYSPSQVFSVSSAVRYDKLENQQYVLTTQSGETNVRGEIDPGIGTLQISGMARVEMRDQQAFQTQASVVDEHIVMNGLTYQPLARRNAFAGTVIVTNLTKTQVYLPNVDYQLTVLGNETRLTRLVGGAILDNEEVLVSYQFDTGGSYSVQQLDQAINLNWQTSKYLSTYYRRFASTPKVTGGAPTYTLNVVNTDVYGANLTIPFSLGAALSLGSNVEHENRQETIAPFVRQSNDIYLQTDESFFGLGNFRLSTRRMRVDYQGMGQDMDMTGYDMRYWARPWYGVDVSASHSIERDTIGSLQQERKIDTLNAQWKERKLTVNARYSRSRESQQGFERDRTMFQIIGVREF